MTTTIAAADRVIAPRSAPPRRNDVRKKVIEYKVFLLRGFGT